MQIRSRLFLRILLMLFLIFVISGCGTKLQKPTGLEQEIEEQPIGLEGVDPSIGLLEEEQPTDAVEVEDANIDDVKPTTESVAKEAHSLPQKTPTIEKQVETKKSPVGTEPKKIEAGPKKPNPQTKPTSQEKNEEPKETVDPAPPASPEPAPEPVQKKPTIVFSIVISPSEIPLSPTEMEIAEGDTVLNALMAITRENKIQMDYRGGQGASAYVEGIANVYEFDRGQGSGWMYRVNGIFPDRGAGVVPLRDGDRVEWLYTTNLGVDLNADLQPFRR